MPLHTAQAPVCEIEVYQAKPFGITQYQAYRALLIERACDHLRKVRQRIFLLHHARVTSSKMKGPACALNSVRESPLHHDEQPSQDFGPGNPTQVRPPASHLIPLPTRHTSSPRLTYTHKPYHTIQARPLNGRAWTLADVAAYQYRVAYGRDAYGEYGESGWRDAPHILQYIALDDMLCPLAQ